MGFFFCCGICGLRKALSPARVINSRCEGGGDRQKTRLASFFQDVIPSMMCSNIRWWFTVEKMNTKALIIISYWIHFNKMILSKKRNLKRKVVCSINEHPIFRVRKLWTLSLSSVLRSSSHDSRKWRSSEAIYPPGRDPSFFSLIRVVREIVKPAFCAEFRLEMLNWKKEGRRKHETKRKEIILSSPKDSSSLSPLRRPDVERMIYRLWIRRKEVDYAPRMIAAFIV